MVRLSALLALAGCATQAATPERPPVSMVVFHSYGPEWPEGGLPFDHPDIQAHAAHYAKQLEAGRLEVGGPHTSGGGGMMIFKPGIPLDEVEAIATSDPAVKKGLIAQKVRPWVRAFEAP